MKRLSLMVAALCALVLTGCSSLPFPLPLPLPPAPERSALEVPAPGDCLDDMNRLDADWRASVSCSEPHLYDVVAVSEWPGMADAVEEHGAKEVFDLIVAYEPGPVVDAYAEWANEFCATAIRETIGWSSLDPRFDDFWVLPSGPYGVDRSLATRADFIGGEQRTLCALGWWEPTVYPAGVTLADMLDPAFPIEMRDCWEEIDEELMFAFCDEPHTDQTLLNFDVSAAFGADFVRAVDAMTDDDWEAAGELCQELAVQVAPGFDLDAMYAWASPDTSEVWMALEDGPPVEGGRYFMTCGIAYADGSSFVGDALTGPVEVTSARSDSGTAV